MWVDFAREGNYTNAGAFGNPNFETHTFRLELLELTTEMGGPLTARVRESDRYLPALPPNNVATVQVKVPSSGLAVAVTHQQDAYSVTEGDSVTVGMVFTTAPHRLCRAAQKLTGVRSRHRGRDSFIINRLRRLVGNPGGPG